MPSAAHEIPLHILLERPALLAALLEKLGPGAPVGVLEPVDANLRFADPTEVRPNLVFRAERPRWLLVELQNRIDADKGRRWLMAAAIQLNATGVMGEVVVITSSRRVARWAKKVARVQGDFGSRLGLTPVVLPIVGKAIDALLDEANPELAFFAAWAVRGRRGPEARRVVGRAVELTECLPDALRDAAARAIVAVLREPLLRYLREIAMNPDQLPETRAARRFRKFFEEQGKREGVIEGKREGVIEGKREGVIEGKREALLQDPRRPRALAVGRGTRHHRRMHGHRAPRPVARAGGDGGLGGRSAGLNTSEGPHVGIAQGSGRTAARASPQAVFTPPPVGYPARTPMPRSRAAHCASS